MSPLEQLRDGLIIKSFRDEEHLNLSQWGRLFKMSSTTIKMAAYRGGIGLKEGNPPNANMATPILIQVRTFPNLIEGFQNTRLRPDGKHFHSWASDVDFEANEIEVDIPRGDTLLYRRPKK